MLDLVNDIDAYPEFLHWCQGASVEAQHGDSVEAALQIGIGGIRQQLKTRNTTRVSDDRREASVMIDMIEGPLQSLTGGWQFTELAPGETEVKLTLDYQIRRTPFGQLLGALFDEIANSQLKAFVRRAGQLYGG